MLKETLISLFSTNLTRLKEEIAAFDEEKNLWLTKKGVSNSAGNLAIHLIGNLNHFIGYVLGNTSYQRNREREFSLKDVPGNEIIQEIDQLQAVINETLSSLNEKDLEKEFPVHVFKNEPPMSTVQMLIHLSNHLNYHLGQINYFRRLHSV